MKIQLHGYYGDQWSPMQHGISADNRFNNFTLPTYSNKVTELQVALCIIYYMYTDIKLLLLILNTCTYHLHVLV